MSFEIDTLDYGDRRRPRFGRRVDYGYKDNRNLSTKTLDTLLTMSEAITFPANDPLIKVSEEVKQEVWTMLMDALRQRLG